MTFSKTNNGLIQLSDHINKTYSLPDFLENELGLDLTWRRDGLSAVCNCPMPDHNDTNASFNMTMKDDYFIWHCFGCGRKGTFVTFCQQYYGMANRLEAIEWICKKFNIKNTEDIIVQGLTSLNKRMDVKRKIDNENIVISNLCRILLKKDFEENKKWVGQKLRLLNKMADEENFDEMQRIAEEASARLGR